MSKLSASSKTPAGILWLVATPIGNLKDVSQRAIETIRAADVLLCEDTRHSQILLTAHAVARPATSYGAHNLRTKLPWVLEQLTLGKCVAYICDAGVPGISDPGTVLVRAVIDAGFDVSAVPGANAALMALVLSGLPTARFVFEGFLPHKKGRQTRLKLLAGEARTIVLYESPHRLLKTLDELLQFLGDRPAAVARELTKMFEEVRRDSLSKLLEHYEASPAKGEIVLVISGKNDRKENLDEEP